MSYYEFQFRNDEFEIDGLLICADVELTIGVDKFTGSPESFNIYGYKYHDLFNRNPPYLRAAMDAWVAANQEKLRQIWIDRNQYVEAAE